MGIRGEAIIGTEDDDLTYEEGQINLDGDISFDEEKLKEPIPDIDDVIVGVEHY